MLSRSALAVVALAIAACDTPPVDAVSPLQFGDRPVGEVLINQTVPISVAIGSPCTKDGTVPRVIEITGQSHLLVTYTQNANGERYLSHTNFLNLRGSGGGVDYVVTAVANDSKTTTIFMSGTQGFVAEATFNVITQTSQDNFLARLNIHYQTNANGETTAIVETREAKCVG